MSELAGKVIAITGASSGIGAALAERVARGGAIPVLVARRREALDAVAAKCGPKAQVAVADVTVREQVRRAVAEAHTKHGRMDVWVNNAGQGITRMPTELTEADIDDMIRINLKSVLFGMQETLSVFRRQGHGHLINISSMLGRVPFALYRSAYTATKHAVNALTEMFRRELAESDPGIRVSLVSPGVVRTDFGKHAIHGGPESGSLPNSQSVDEVAEVIANVIATRRADVYTAAGAKARVSAYYAGLGEDP